MKQSTSNLTNKKRNAEGAGTVENYLRQLRYALTLNRISDLIISHDRADEIFDDLAKILGETLLVDHVVVFDVSYLEESLITLAEWSDPAVEVRSMRGKYPIENYANSIFEIERSRSYQVSSFDHVNPFFEKDGAAEILHKQLGIKSGLWFPFAFYVGGYHLLVLQQVQSSRVWTKDELEFLGSTGRQVSIALGKLYLVEQRKRAEDEIQWNFNVQTALMRLLRLSLASFTLDEILQQALEIIVYLPWISIEPRGAIFLIDEVTQSLVVKAQYNMPENLLQACSAVQFGQCYCRQAALTKQIQFIGPAENGKSTLCDQISGHGHYCIPILWDDEILGVINLYIDSKRRRIERDQNFLKMIADALVSIIHRKKMEDTLKDAENKYRSLVEQLPLVVYTAHLGYNGAWTYVSPQIEQLLGFTPQEWISDPNLWYQQIHPDDKDREQKIEEDCALYGGTFDSDYRMFTRDQREIWVRDNGLIIQSPSGGPPMVQGVLMDVTERKRAEMEVARYAKNTATMYELSQNIHTHANLEQICASTHKAVEHMMPCDAFVVTLVDEEKREVQDVYLWDQNQLWPVEHYPIGQNLTGYILYTCRPLRVNDWTDVHDQLVQTSLFGELDDPVKSLMAVPLVRSNGTCFGMISVQAYQANAFNSEHEQLLVTLANQVSKTFDTAQLFAKLEQSNKELSLAYDATIEGWSRAMDLRDKETEGHTERVTEMALRLSLAMGLDEASRIHMRRGSLLHDIGKLGVPDDILLKQDDLTDAEWEIMQRHPIFAFNMLSQIPYLKHALDIPYCHHEKWDGSGYPRGLKGEEIPLAARIFAVVDVWDALRSDRPYRKGWQPSRIRQYILEQRGKHFDPQVVDVFCELTRDI